LRVWDDYLAAAEARDILTKCGDISQSGFLVHENVRGQQVKRRSCAFSDPGYTYSYNGASHTGRDWPPWLSRMRDRLAKLINQPLEFCLLTEYPKGASLGKHKDDESEIVNDSKIICLSVGETRTLEIWDGPKVVERLQIDEGTVYSMEGKFQTFLKHGINQGPPKGKVRFSFTFRHLNKPAPVAPQSKQGTKRKTLNKQSAKDRNKKERAGPESGIMK
jgi:alkylated DNA repair dioxygenase AlkB